MGKFFTTKETGKRTVTPHDDSAALLAKMGYNEKEKREVRIAYLRMILRLQNKLDDARLALIMSVGLTCIISPIERKEKRYCAN
ncbi:hypothetical protein [Paenibacillus sp. GCM10027626]|uniref:hypothetical protein n=1 Tax=Paenibacillus sp. GCM10027626 TaxID=3273411 RepID=UPI00362D97F5